MDNMSTLRKNNQKERQKNVFNVKLVGKKKKIKLILGINCVELRYVLDVYLW